MSSYKEATAWASFEMLEGAEDAISRRSAIVWLTSRELSKVRFVKAESGPARTWSFLQKSDADPSDRSFEQEAGKKSRRMNATNADSF